MKPIVVYKFGSSVLRSTQDLPRVVHEIYRAWRSGKRVVAVVSALGSTTDELFSLGRAWGCDSGARAMAGLVATGESAAANLLALALDRSGVHCEVFEPWRAGLQAQGEPLDSTPIRLQRGKLLAALERNPVLVLPGFLAVDHDGRPALLGRGGSDLTALFLARELGAVACRLYKDVDGLYEWDPRRPGPGPRRFEQVGWQRASSLDEGIVQPKALAYAREQGSSFEVGACGARAFTRVGHVLDRFAERPLPSRFRVGLLGLGTVGLGVLRQLEVWPEHFELAGVVVRDRRRASNHGIAADRIFNDAKDLLRLDCDVIVELIGGLDPARAWIEASLRRGCSVVTANKQLLAEAGSELQHLAALHDRSLLGSASVGGALPALEWVARAGERGSIHSIEAILNGTSNYLLGRLEQGADFPQALSRACAEGWAEADPTRDVAGLDAADKLELLTRAAFGDRVPIRWTERVGIDGLDPEAVRKAPQRGGRIRLLAVAKNLGTAIEARIAPTWLPLAHPLTRLDEEQNGLLLTPTRGEPWLLTGKGAGRWPTAESVLADLFDLHARKSDRNDRETEFEEVAA